MTTTTNTTIKHTKSPIAVKVMNYIYVQANIISKMTDIESPRRLNDLAYIRGMVGAMYLSDQITEEEYRELNTELGCVKIRGSEFFSLSKSSAIVE